MPAYYETGHPKNVATFFKYNQFLTTLGTAYNPSSIAITLPSLTTSQTTGATKQTNVNTKTEGWKDATNLREKPFKDLPAFSTQIFGALKSFNPSQLTIDDFAYQVSKMHGYDNAKTNQNDKGKIAIDPSNPSTLPVTPSKSNSQQSFDQKLEHLEKMILILQTVPSYLPNEVNLQIASLQAYLITLKNLNVAAEQAKSDLKAARLDRNTFFYAPGTGFLDLVKQSKEYIKSVFGATSQQYKTALTFKFTRVIPKKKSK
ncbi:MAG: hypothetical protein JSU07_05015 [Bacteroidetes bacterium]|nr:hypothetical protein [Bacteroidota bacterium]